MILNETCALHGGAAIPRLGLGTWMIDDDRAAQAVREAVKLGYRLIDTAQAYGNERGVGEGVCTCGVPREELFVASKVAAELKSYDAATKSIDETLEKMGLTYLDQMIIHAPQPWGEFRGAKRYFGENREVWRALEDAQAAGRVRVIGVSNFLRDNLENLMQSCRVRPIARVGVVEQIGKPDAPVHLDEGSAADPDQQRPGRAVFAVLGQKQIQRQGAGGHSEPVGDVGVDDVGNQRDAGPFDGRINAAAHGTPFGNP